LSQYYSRTNKMSRTLFILGTRGIPANHGGFETFAEKLSLYLGDKDWTVYVFCQCTDNKDEKMTVWNGIHLIYVPVNIYGPLGTILYDLKVTIRALSLHGLFLTLGYNTAIFNLLQRINGQINLINMDGIEWRREKWGYIARMWFWINERAGCLIGNHLIADHPQIKKHLSTRVRLEKITMIPYGANEVIDGNKSLLLPFNLEPNKYSVIIARPEPENSLLEMVRAFSQQPRNHKLVVLGNFSPDANKYHLKVIQSASDEVIFVGAIYDAPIVESLRFFSRFYIHGHRVGGTNPSLVEALGAGCAVIAHDNQFNRWVAGTSAAYFADEKSLAELFSYLLINDSAVSEMKSAAIARFKERFTWDQILQEYEALLNEWYPK